MPLKILADEDVDFRLIKNLRTKGFGTWVFAHCEKCTGIIYLRYKAGEVETIFNSLHTTLAKYGNYLYNKFTVITPGKLRIRELPD